jgi:hypothetical protein
MVIGGGVAVVGGALGDDGVTLGEAADPGVGDGAGVEVWDGAAA